MSFKAELNLEGKTYPIRRFNFRITQDIDSIGRPRSDTRGGMMVLTLDATSDEQFSTWMFNTDKKLSGTIHLFQADQHSVLKKIDFHEAFCVYYKESFNALGGEPLQLDLRLSAERISVGNTLMQNNWPK